MTTLRSSFSRLTQAGIAIDDQEVMRNRELATLAITLAARRRRTPVGSVRQPGDPGDST